MPRSTRRSSRDHFKNPDEALVEIYRRLRPGDPPTVESARALFRGMFLDPRRYDLARVGRFMINKKLGIGANLNIKTLRSEDVVYVVRHLFQVKLGSKSDRRHRPPRQPARALGGRAAREPVPGGPDPHGAGGQGADVDLRHHQPDAARPDQRQAGLGGGEGVLRLLAAQPVHGPDQPAGRADPQAPPLRPGPARSLAGARGLRGARRPSDPLRPDLPDRDAGRPEHRPDLLALHLRAHQRVRLHRDPLPQGRARQRAPGRPDLPHRARGRAATSLRRPTRR